MDDLDKQQFLLDHIQGMDASSLAQKWGISQQAAASRLRWAESKGDIERVRAAVAKLRIQEDTPGDIMSPAERSIDNPVQEQPETVRRPRTPEEIRAMFGSLQDLNNMGRLRASVQSRIMAYEKRIGRKDPGFRMAQELWVRKERCRLLGLTLNDMRRMRGIAV